MTTNQPHFEHLKSIFFNAFVNSDKATFHLLLNSLDGKLRPHFSLRHQEFKKEFNQWLDRVDIRQASVLIDVLNEIDVSIPKWMREKNFVIEYNNHSFLDLIQVK
jgi:hypothetical protein